jgi:hypothetical protein
MELVNLPSVPSFSIGINTKKKKPKKKLNKKTKKFTSLYYPQPSAPIKFEIYSGPRWLLPNCIIASESVQYKFSLLNTIFSFREIKFKIAEYIRNLKFRFTILPQYQWKPPTHITSQITSFYAKQENEWNRVRAIYYKLFKLRQILGPLIFRWQIKKCLKNCKNVEDPVTLERPKKPVTVIDFKKRISFIYDASTLKKTIENRLLLSDYMFPEPKEPVNLLTNEPFNLGQLISVYNQCLKYGEFSWTIESLKNFSGDLNMFSIYNKQKLKIEAINSFFKKSTFVIRDIVIDYFNLEADYSDMPDPSCTRFINAYDTTPERGIVQEWIGHTREYYIAKELNEPFLLIKSAKDTDILINKIYKVFQYSC